MRDESLKLTETYADGLELPDLEAILLEALPALEVVDRDLMLGAALSAQLVCVDGRGRLVLGLLAENGSESTVLECLDALAYARAHLELLKRHLGASQLRTDLEPHLVLVSESFPPRVIERLGPILGHSLHMFEVRVVRSRAAAASYLVPVAPARVHGAAAVAGDSRTFIDALPESERSVAALVVQRIARIDDEIELALAGDELEWRYGGVVLCSLSRGEAGLEGSVLSVPTTVLSETGVDDFVEAALGRYVELLGGTDDEGEELEQVELVPPEPGALLTPEEIEAFRD